MGATCRMSQMLRRLAAAHHDELSVEDDDATATTPRLCSAVRPPPPPPPNSVPGIWLESAATHTSPEALGQPWRWASAPNTTITRRFRHGRHCHVLTEQIISGKVQNRV
ncbi:hypothetical protein JDV02_006375 [Purpureocillium takamizusanense]|uniref:Uncharacterized protein n=1 Tax=Purpureocillium takamizusanense TaxID=2060973 RepID=A0A9Q8QI51_9HYPO|nr:uncharacterized protein JDV02_006375 [Purpureocillium takamizusanense]UNI20273.1 hypothetical protein JDV02_006375 [Purpureocillium takamizusanense]